MNPSPPDRRPLVLASASPRRRELLSLLRLPFEVVPSAYEEVLPDRHPDAEALAIHLAKEKALNVAAERPEAVVIGADTIVALGEQLFGKPADTGDAARMLGELSGRIHQVVTGVTVIVPGVSPHVRSFSSNTDVHFRPVEDAEIQAYVATGEPMDKAGAYAIQGHGAILIDRIRGDYPNVVGLPLTPLALMLRALGFPVLGIPPAD